MKWSHRRSENVVRIDTLHVGGRFTDVLGVKYAVVRKTEHYTIVRKEMTEFNTMFANCADVTPEKDHKPFGGLTIEDPGCYPSPSDPEVLDEVKRAAMDVLQFGRSALQRGPAVENVGPRPVRK
jgi:hypothetical protein